MNSTAVGSESVASALAAQAFGWRANATGERSAALGHLANASGLRSTAVGEAANAAGARAVAIGDLSSAAFDDSVALGAGAVTTRVNQVAIGNANSTYTLAGVSSAASRAAQSGPTQFVTADANGNLATDGGAISGMMQDFDNDLDRVRDGVAMGLAMDVPAMPSNGTFAIGGGVATYDGAQAMAMGGAFRLNERMVFTTGVGVGFDKGEVGARAGFQYAW